MDGSAVCKAGTTCMQSRDHLLPNGSSAEGLRTVGAKVLLTIQIRQTCRGCRGWWTSWWTWASGRPVAGRIRKCRTFFVSPKALALH